MQKPTYSFLQELTCSFEIDYKCLFWLIEELMVIETLLLGLFLILKMSIIFLDEVTCTFDGACI